MSEAAKCPDKLGKFLAKLGEFIADKPAVITVSFGFDHGLQRVSFCTTCYKKLADTDEWWDRAAHLKECGKDAGMGRSKRKAGRGGSD